MGLVSFISISTASAESPRLRLPRTPSLAHLWETLYPWASIDYYFIIKIDVDDTYHISYMRR